MRRLDSCEVVSDAGLSYNDIGPNVRLADPANRSSRQLFVGALTYLGPHKARLTSPKVMRHSWAVWTALHSDYASTEGAIRGTRETRMDACPSTHVSLQHDLITRTIDTNVSARLPRPAVQSRYKSQITCPASVKRFPGIFAPIGAWLSYRRSVSSERPSNFNAGKAADSALAHTHMP